MRTRSKVVVASLVAALALAAHVTAASAGRLEMDDDDFKIIWNEFSFYLDNEDTPLVRCRVTFLGSFHRQTFTKNTELVIGVIRFADRTAASCVGGEMSILQASLPWNIRYLMFWGTLPGIDDIFLSILGTGISIRNPLGVICLLRSSTIEPLNIRMDVGFIALEYAIPTIHQIDFSDISGTVCDMELNDDGNFGESGEVEDSTAHPLIATLI